MTNKITVILTLTILIMFFIAGCAKTEIEPTTPAQPTPEETGDEAVSEISEDISDIDIMLDHVFVKKHIFKPCRWLNVNYK